ncbi:hypothetical protein Dfri01_59400 [Dyadobacter frigoris]|nr:hypothetical protein Dfri01_59400 [Dyadobacter frigoris]
MFAVVDLFAGAGGTSQGLVESGKAVVIACANHDLTAMESHAINHPLAIHFVEDIRLINIWVIQELVTDIRKLYPHVKIGVWMSPDCTHHSYAAGGRSRNADSRALAKSLHMVYDPENPNSEEGFVAGDSYVQILKPDFVQIENVIEFKSWGPLTAKTEKVKNEGLKEKAIACPIIWEKKLKRFQPKVWVPEEKSKGKYFLQWQNAINQLGYNDDWRELNAADFGAHTSRKRLFGIFVNESMPIRWPEATHAQKPKQNTLFESYIKWRPVSECINFENEGNSIFGRKKDYCEKTLIRLYTGLNRYVPKGNDSFICKYYGNGGQWSDINSPSGTLTTKDRMAVVFIDQQYGNSKPVRINQPASTLTTNPKLNVVFVLKSAPIKTTKQNAHFRVSSETGLSEIIIYESDSEIIRKIKVFMAENGIVDIRMRGLEIMEMLLIQGFPANYILRGSETLKKKFIGNSVAPIIPKVWIEAMATTFNGVYAAVA